MCVVCKHPKRAEIDTALARGQTAREVSSTFEVPLGAVGRHRREHVAKDSPPVADAGARRRATSTPREGNMTDSAVAIGQLERDLAAHVGEPDHDYRVSAEIARAICAHARALARVERARGPQRLDVLVHPAFEKLVGRLLGVLDEKHPEARASLAAAVIRLVGEAQAEYQPRVVAGALSRLVDVLRVEADEAPAGRARSSVSSALASAISAQERLRAAWTR